MKFYFLFHFSFFITKENNTFILLIKYKGYIYRLITKIKNFKVDF